MVLGQRSHRAGGDVERLERRGIAVVGQTVNRPWARRDWSACCRNALCYTALIGKTSEPETPAVPQYSNV